MPRARPARGECLVCGQVPHEEVFLKAKQEEGEGVGGRSARYVARTHTNLRVYTPYVLFLWFTVERGKRALS